MTTSDGREFGQRMDSWGGVHQYDRFAGYAALQAAGMEERERTLRAASWELFGDLVKDLPQGQLEFNAKQTTEFPLPNATLQVDAAFKFEVSASVKGRPHNLAAKATVDLFSSKAAGKPKWGGISDDLKTKIGDLTYGAKVSGLATGNIAIAFASGATLYQTKAKFSQDGSFAAELHASPISFELPGAPNLEFTAKPSAEVKFSIKPEVSKLGTGPLPWLGPLFLYVGLAAAAALIIFSGGGAAAGFAAAAL